MNNHNHITARVLEWIPIALCIAWVGVTLAWLPRSLALDEFGTYWVIEEGWSEALRRAIHYQGQSPLYYQVVWIFARSLGDSEVVLRLPSVIAAGFSAMLVGRIARRLGPREAFVPAVLLFTLGWAFSTELGANARPYSLALVFFLASLRSCLSWAREPLGRHLVAATAFFLLCVYSHYLFAPCALVLGLALLSERRVGRREALQLVVAGAFAVVALLPSLMQLSLLVGKIPHYEFSSTPSALQLASDALPLELIVVIALLAMTRSLVPGMVVRDRIPPRSAWLLGAWIALPPLVCYALSSTGVMSVYVSRYFLWQAPGIAIAAALLLSTLTSRSVRAASLIALGLFHLYSSWIEYDPHGLEDWRSAVGVLAEKHDAGGEAHCIVLYSGLIESNSLEWLSNAERRRYMSSSIRYHADMGPIRLIPWNPHKPELAAHVAELTQSLQHDCDHGTAVVRMIYYQVGDAVYDTDQLVRGYLSLAGFAGSQPDRHGGVSVIDFVRDVEARGERRP